MGRGWAILLGVLTFWPWVYLPLAMGVGLSLTAMTHASPQNGPMMSSLFFVLFAVHMLTALLCLVLLAFYLIHLFAAKRVPPEKQALWAAVLFFGNIMAMPFYWYHYVWRKPPVTPSDILRTL